jgi:hypothetical protein
MKLIYKIIKLMKSTHSKIAATTRAIQKVTFSELLTAQEMRKNLLYTKKYHIHT